MSSILSESDQCRIPVLECIKSTDIVTQEARCLRWMVIESIIVPPVGGDVVDAVVGIVDDLEMGEDLW